MPNVCNVHTCTTCHVNMVIFVVLGSHVQLLEFTRDMIGSTSIGVPICINPIGVGCSSSSSLLCPVGFIKTVLALNRRVPLLFTHLAHQTLAAVVEVATTFVVIVGVGAIVVGVAVAPSGATVTAVATVATASAEAITPTHSGICKRHVAA
jgi:hypothetical protein